MRLLKNSLAQAAGDFVKQSDARLEALQAIVEALVKVFSPFDDWLPMPGRVFQQPHIVFARRVAQSPAHARTAKATSGAPGWVLLIGPTN